MKAIADTGVIVALLDRTDPAHQWAAKAFRERAPFHTCEAVIVEAASFFPTPEPVLKLVSRGDLILDFDLGEEMEAVLALAAKYADRPMDVADGCVVRMTELAAACKVWTVDRGDFTAYRRNGRQIIPCECPP